MCSRSKKAGIAPSWLKLWGPAPMQSLLFHVPDSCKPQTHPDPSCNPLPHTVAWLRVDEAQPRGHASAVAHGHDGLSRPLAALAAHGSGR